MHETNTEDYILKLYSGAKTFSLKRLILCSVAVFTVLLTLIVTVSIHNTKTASMFGDDDIDFAMRPFAATTAKRSHISIPNGIVKANPFLPYRNIGNETKKDIVDDVPRFDLIEPPETVGAGSDAARVLDTIVSGILYDKYSPSAILNIEGNDYLVKNGDVINNYKVVAINQDSVTVKLGSNTYKAGIGEILTDGDVQYNTISNLNKKFGGEKR